MVALQRRVALTEWRLRVLMSAQHVQLASIDVYKNQHMLSEVSEDVYIVRLASDAGLTAQKRRMSSETGQSKTFQTYSITKSTSQSADTIRRMSRKLHVTRVISDTMEMNATL